MTTTCSSDLKSAVNELVNALKRSSDMINNLQDEITVVNKKIDSRFPSSAYNTQLTNTSATSVLSYTPSIAGLYVVWVYYRVVTGATNLGIACTYTDLSGSQTKTILTSASQAVGSYSCTPLFISSTASAITVTATAGTANNVYVSSAVTSIMQ